jgi:hypothetical protein
MSSPEWIALTNGAGVLAVARARGHEVRQARGTSGGAVYGCPACGSAKRHTKTHDPRGAVGVERTGRGWRCHQCDASGDALDFVALGLGGARFRELSDSGKAEVRVWCQRLVGGAAVASVRPTATREPRYLTTAEVEAVWTLGEPADVAPGIARWLAGRGIDPIAVVERDLMRGLPAYGPLPRWAGVDLPSGHRSWPSYGYRAILPLYDAEGHRRSLIFRRPGPAEPDKKSRGASGYERAGLAMLCPFARQLYTARAWPDWWLVDAERRVHVVEGEMDYLTLATSYGGADASAPPVIGIISGSAPILDRLPPCTVTVTTHDDAAGAIYRDQITTRLRARADITLEIAQPGDINDRLQAGLPLLGPATVVQRASR